MPNPSEASAKPIYQYMNGKKTKCHALHCECTLVCGPEKKQMRDSRAGRKHWVPDGPLVLPDHEIIERYVEEMY